MKNRNLPIEEARIRRLLAVGCPVPAEDDISRAPGLTVEVRNPERTEALDFRAGTEYILDLRIKNTSFARLKVKDLRPFPPWKDENFTWLVDPHVYAPDRKAYVMEESGRKIPYESVLNHRIRKMELEPGDCYEGMLLGWSIWTRISTDYLHRETFPMRIALIDQYGRSHLSVIEVRVDRSATIYMPDFNKKGTGLYGRNSSQARAVVGREDPRMPHRQPEVSPYVHASSEGRPQHKAPRTETDAEM